jgi:hypothetical protein
MNKLASRLTIAVLAGIVTLGTFGCGGGGNDGPSTLRAWVLDTSNNLRRVRLDTGAIETNPLAITGMQGGEGALGIDFRPADDQLYVLGNTGRIYRVNTSTGVATLVGVGFAGALSGTAFGVDFNPVVDRLRIVSDADQNVRIDPDTTALVTDTALNYAAGDANQGANPAVMAVAYTNNFVGATATTLYGLDSGTNALVIQNPPNGGVLNTVATLVDFGGEGGLDIDGSDSSAYAVLLTAGNTESTLYRIDLASGIALAIAPVVSGGPSRDIAIIP